MDVFVIIGGMHVLVFRVMLHALRTIMHRSPTRTPTFLFIKHPTFIFSSISLLIPYNTPTAALYRLLRRQARWLVRGWLSHPGRQPHTSIITLHHHTSNSSSSYITFIEQQMAARGGGSKEERQPLTSGADVKPVYCVPRSGSISSAGEVSVKREGGAAIYRQAVWTFN